MITDRESRARKLETEPLVGFPVLPLICIIEIFPSVLVRVSRETKSVGYMYIYKGIP